MDSLTQETQQASTVPTSTKSGQVRSEFVVDSDERRVFGFEPQLV